MRSRKPGSYEEALIHLKQVHNANYLHLVINHKLNLTILTNYKLWSFLIKILLTEQSYFVVIPKVWDVRADQVVRSINGPYICGEGIDIWEDSVLTASWVAHDSLQVHFQPRPQGFSLKKWVEPHPFFKGKALGTRLVHFRLTAKVCFVWVISQEGKQTFFFSWLQHWFSQFSHIYLCSSFLH